MRDLTQTIIKTEAFENLKEKFESGKLSHAFLVVCADPLLKQSFINNVAKLLLENKEMVDALSHPDFYLVSGNDKGNIIVEDVANAIDKLNLSPIIAKNKVLIIDAKNPLTERIQNKLLKTLEEPPRSTFVFIAIANISGVLPTIISRTQNITLRDLTKEELLVLGYDVDIIEKANNKLWLIEKLSNIKEKEKFNQVIKILKQMQKSSNVIEFSRTLIKSKDEFKEFLFYFSHIFASIVDSRVKGKNFFDLEISDNFSNIICAMCIDAVDVAVKQIDASCNLSIIADNFLFKILEVKYKCKKNI